MSGAITTDASDTFGGRGDAITASRRWTRHRLRARSLYFELGPPGFGRRALHLAEHVGLREQPIAVLGRVEHRLDQVGARVDAALLQPEDDVRLAAHRPDLDYLLAAEEFGGDAGIDAIRQPVVAFSLRLDHGRRMDAGRGAEGIPAEHRIVRGDRHAGAFGYHLAHFAELAEVGVDPA